MKIRWNKRLDLNTVTCTSTAPTDGKMTLSFLTNQYLLFYKIFLAIKLMTMYF